MFGQQQQQLYKQRIFTNTSGFISNILHSTSSTRLTAEIVNTYKVHPNKWPHAKSLVATISHETWMNVYEWMYVTCTTYYRGSTLLMLTLNVVNIPIWYIYTICLR